MAHHPPDIKDKIIEKIKLGVNFKTAAQVNGIDRSTFYKWMEDDPTFKTHIEEAKAHAKAVIEERLNVAQIDDWRAGAWILERRHPGEYGKREFIQKTVKHQFTDEQTKMLEALREASGIKLQAEAGIKDRGVADVRSKHGSDAKRKNVHPKATASKLPIRISRAKNSRANNGGEA